jgi:hypothetical protein
MPEDLTSLSRMSSVYICTEMRRATGGGDWLHSDMRQRFQNKKCHLVIPHMWSGGCQEEGTEIVLHTFGRRRRTPSLA